MKYLSILLFACLTIVACKPTDLEKTDIGEPPVASFTIAAGSDANHFMLTNTTAETFITQWDLGNGLRGEGASFEAYYPYAGTYAITMTTFNKGGYSRTTQNVVVANDDPNACNGALALLTNCGSKTWRLDPNPGALHVGPDLVQVWWANSAADVITRACLFNDTYTFNVNGTVDFNDNGDFWAEADGNGNVFPADLGVAPGCTANTSWPSQYAVWGSGTHNFVVSETTLTLAGLGAWMGLYKIGSQAEIGQPQTSVNFNLVSLTADRMVIAVSYSNGVNWRFTYVSN